MAQGAGVGGAGVSEGSLPRLERLLEQAARRLSAAGLHPLRLRDQIVETFDANVREGDAPNEMRVLLHPADFSRLQPELPSFRMEMLQVLAERARAGGSRSIGERSLRFVADPRVPAGTSRITARFTHAPAPGAVRLPVQETRRLFPVHDLALRLPGGERVQVTHVPWRIGRGPDNDLVLASMAVSRHHAEIARTGRGLVVRDMGSRNGVVVDGRPAHEAVIAPGAVFTLGDVELTLEGGAA